MQDGDDNVSISVSVQHIKAHKLIHLVCVDLTDYTRDKSMRGNAFSQTGSSTVMASLALKSDHSDITGKVSSCKAAAAAEPLQMPFTVRAIKLPRAVRLKRASVLDHFLCV